MAWMRIAERLGAGDRLSAQAAVAVHRAMDCLKQGWSTEALLDHVRRLAAEAGATRQRLTWRVPDGAASAVPPFKAPTPRSVKMNFPTLGGEAPQIARNSC